MGGWPGAVANAQIDPRVRNAALGFVGATQDLPSYTQGGGELVVFSVPKQEAAGPSRPSTILESRRSDNARCSDRLYRPWFGRLGCARAARSTNQIGQPMQPEASPRSEMSVPAIEATPGASAPLCVGEPHPACARLWSPSGQCSSRAKDQQSARSGSAGDDPRHAGLQSVQLRRLPCGEWRRRNGASAERGPLRLWVDAREFVPQHLSGASQRDASLAELCRSRRSGSSSPTSRAWLIRRAQPSAARFRERHRPHRSSRRPRSSCKRRNLGAPRPPLATGKSRSESDAMRGVRLTILSMQLRGICIGLPIRRRPDGLPPR